MSDLKIYAQNLGSAAMEQIETLASAPAFDGARIRIMPECPVREREFKLMCSMSIDCEAKTMESEDDGVLLG